MTTSEKNTLFYIGLFGICAFLAWKLWPAIRRAINSGSTGGGAMGVSGASNASPYDPYGSGSSSSPSSGLGGSLGLGGGSGGGPSLSPGGYSASNSALATALDNLLQDGSNASDQLAADSDYQVSQVTSADQIAYVPYQLYDVDQNDTNMPDAGATDYSSYDTNNYGDSGQIDDGGGGGGSGEQYSY